MLDFRASLAGMSLAHFLPLDHSEHHVFRAVVLSIVLTLAVGPNATLLCGTLCDPPAAAASACHDEDPATSPSVGGDDSCDHVVLNAAAFLREDVRRGVFAPDAGHAILVPCYQLAHSTTDARPGQEPGPEWSLDQRPVSTALRI